MLRFAAFAAAAASAAAARSGLQVHTSLGEETNELNVAWTTPDGADESSIEWGLTCDLPMYWKQPGDVREFTQDASRTWYTRTATLTNLRNDTEYCFRVGTNVAMRPETFKIKFRPQQMPYQHIIFGDMGAAAGFALCDACTQYDLVCDCDAAKNKSAGLVAEVPTAGLFYHIGDFAYDLGDQDGTVGDAFMSNVEQIAAHQIYQPVHGNHEDRGNNLAHYLERFRNVHTNGVPAKVRTDNGMTVNSLYYSFDYQMVHYVSISTELWQNATKVDNVTVAGFLKWLEADLRKANANRAAFPWVMVAGHRALYTSEPKGQTTYDIKMREDLEPIFFKYGVDFCLNGHIHNYERTWPLYQNKSVHSNVDPKAPIYIVTGAAGSREMSSPFQQPAPAWSAFRSNSFSYSRLFVHNATHVHWQQVQTDPINFPNERYGRVIDDFWVVQHRHGPFDPADAPQTTPAYSGVTHDHFTPQMLDIDDGSGAPTWQQIQRFKAQHGTEAFAAKMKTLLARFNAGRANLEWEQESVAADTRPFFSWAGEEP